MLLCSMFCFVIVMFEFCRINLMHMGIESITCQDKPTLLHMQFETNNLIAIAKVMNIQLAPFFK